MGGYKERSSVTVQRKKARINHRFYANSQKKNEPSPEVESDAEPEIDPQKVIGPPLIRLLCSSEKTLFLSLLAYRLINALMIQTAFVPDEYWQSLEVAHHSAFGYGYLTWEWRARIRSYLYPLIFTLMYKVLHFVSLDYAVLLIKLPKLFHGLCQAVCDLYLYKLSRKLGDQGTAQWTLFCQLTSWFTFYCGPRTLTNSMETVLVTVGMYHFPWPNKPRKDQRKFVLLVAASTIIRPTAAVIWLPLCVWHLYLYRHILVRIMSMYFRTALLATFFSLCVDLMFFGQWTFVPWNFIKFNVLNDMGRLYGTHPWHWYFSQGFPAITTAHLIPFILGVWLSKNRVPFYVMLWTMSVYSYTGHKEFRFIFPVLPLAMHYCGEWLSLLSKPRPKVNGDEKHKDAYDRTVLRFMLGLIVCVNLPIALYASLLHQRGTIDVMGYIQHLVMNTDFLHRLNVLFLMPCHSTPFYSSVHENISMRFLTCEPDLDGRQNYTDEADVFYADPSRWLNTEYANRTPPSHLVMFDSLMPSIREFLSTYSYQTCARYFHTHLSEPRTGNYVHVFCRR